MRFSIGGQYLAELAAAKPWRVSLHKTFKSWPKENGKDRAPTEVWELGTPSGDGHGEHHQKKTAAE